MRDAEIKVKKNWPEMRFNILICALFAFSPIKNALSVASQHVGVPSQILTLICYGVLALLVMYSIPLIVRRFPWQEITIFIVMTVFLLFSWGLNSDGSANGFFQTLLVEYLFAAAAGYFLCRCVDDFSKLFRYLGVSAYLIVGAQALILLWGSSTWDSNGSLYYSQSFAYQTLPAAIILISGLFRKFSWMSLIALVAAVFILFASGSRGPLLVTGVYIVVRALFDARRKPLRLILLLAAGFFFIFGEQILLQLLEPLSGILESQGFSIRNLYLIFNNEFFVSVGRDETAQAAIKGIEMYPLTGMGLGNDRLFIANELNKPPDLAAGYYAHNIILEFLMQYGVVGGLLLMVVLLVLFAAAYKKCIADDDRDVLLIVATCGIMPLFVSGSYLTSLSFYMFLGICVNLAFSQKEKMIQPSSVEPKE